MNVIIRALFVIGVFLSLSTQLFAKEPIKYGKVDMADLTMTKYPLDSTASAVVLCNYGFFNAQLFNYVQNIRIKILTEEGKNWGNFELPVGEHSTVKGQTYNLENGKIVISKLKSESIFREEEVKGHFSLRVAMPDVKVGSIIDMEFVYRDLPSVFEFQNTIPVRWSELVIEPHLNVSYRKNFSGYFPFSESSDDRWVAKDIPAFKSESYMKSPKNYMKRVEINVASIQIPEQMIYKSFASSWESVVDLLKKDEEFGGAIKSFAFYLDNTASKIKSENKSEEDKMLAAFNEIKKIKWNNRLTWWSTTEGLSEAFKKKSGNSAQINILLLILLRKLDIKAEPILLSTRENGEIQPHVVSYNHFNHVMARATIGEKTYMMDAVDEYLPVNLLPRRNFNGRGLLIKKDGFEWVDIEAVKKEKSTQVYNLEISENGTLKGVQSKTYMDYSALDARNEYHQFTALDEYLKAIENKSIGLTIEDYKSKNIDSLSLPFVETYNVVIKKKIVVADGKMIMKLQPFEDLITNPFKLDERLYPVDYSTPIERIVIYSFRLPDGYTVEQLPASERASMPENGGGFSRAVTNNNDGTIQLMYKLNINNTLFLPNQYNDLKAFYDYIINKQNEMIILKKV